MRTGHAGGEDHELGHLARGRQELRQAGAPEDDHLAVRMGSALRISIMSQSIIRQAGSETTKLFLCSGTELWWSKFWAKTHRTPACGQMFNPGAA